jgi:SAM-dependent methyltransferase
MEKPDYGTYHHSTPAESNAFREIAGRMFEEAFSRLPIGRDEPVRILDLGCGLGFLTAIAATYFRNARITAVDNFEDSSLSGSSIKLASDNMRILNIADRVTLIKLDITKPFAFDHTFDIGTSNLVIHNTGRHRFLVYENTRKVLNDKGYFINGDLFISKNRSAGKYEYDMGKISKIFRPLFSLSPESGGNQIHRAFRVVALQAI